MGKWLALWKYFKRATEVKTPLPSPILAVYFQQYLHAGGIVATNKEVQCVIDTIMMGHCTYNGPIGVLYEERVQISRYACC